MKERNRSAGILLHPTALPGKFGIGEFGEDAHRFIDALSRAGCRLWQILPLCPTGFGNSPYSSYSTFAGNPLLISIEKLLSDNWITESEITPPPAGFDSDKVDFDKLYAWKMPTLRTVFNRFKVKSDSDEKKWLVDYRKANAEWLEDYALFMALKSENPDKCWNEWDKSLAARVPAAIDQAKTRLAEEIDFQIFMQFLFDRQWDGIRNHCQEAGIEIVGDVPIFVALDSSDVWTNQELFFLDEEGAPTVVAGVPPDYFCATGQLWGNPLYNWKIHKKENFKWWLKRLLYTFKRVDILRIDHFRGLEAYWEVPAKDKTAENGTWIKAPGDDFLNAVKNEFGDLKIIAEDLGVITPEVDALREKFNLPGMRVLQFAFGGEDPKEATHAMHNHSPDLIVYTGTHDNDTTYGWFHGKDNEFDIRPEEQRTLERDNCLAYMGQGEDFEINWKMINLAFMSVADTAIVPFQDVLGLGSEARFNRPGIAGPMNWSWRMTSDELDVFCSDEITGRLHELVYRYGRK
ncbi:MAG: 4-alpha-glucanotransferase [Planctomycetota bacterium]|jgi:4-alpha-glucanotransferase